MGPRQPYTVRLRSPDKVYLARVTNELRIVFQIEDDVMTILDIVTRDQLHHLSRFYI
jgi:Txe/YoeB family toxin of Txe-Axe toxin-antitoxin module